MAGTEISPLDMQYTPRKEGVISLLVPIEHIHTSWTNLIIIDGAGKQEIFTPFHTWIYSAWHPSPARLFPETSALDTATRNLIFRSLGQGCSCLVVSWL